MIGGVWRRLSAGRVRQYSALRRRGSSARQGRAAYADAPRHRRVRRLGEARRCTFSTLRPRSFPLPCDFDWEGDLPPDSAPQRRMCGSCSRSKKKKKLPAGRTQGKPSADLSTRMINGDNVRRRAFLKREFELAGIAEERAVLRARWCR